MKNIWKKYRNRSSISHENIQIVLFCPIVQHDLADSHWSIMDSWPGIGQWNTQMRMSHFSWVSTFCFLWQKIRSEFYKDIFPFAPSSVSAASAVTSSPKVPACPQSVDSIHHHNGTFSCRCCTAHTITRVTLLPATFRLLRKFNKSEMKSRKNKKSYSKWLATLWRLNAIQMNCLICTTVFPLRRCYNAFKGATGLKGEANANSNSPK